MKDNDIKMVIDKLNYLENELAILKSSIQTNRVAIQELQNQINQLNQKFNAHRDKKDIHDKRLLI